MLCKSVNTTLDPLFLQGRTELSESMRQRKNEIKSAIGIHMKR